MDFLLHIKALILASMLKLFFIAIWSTFLCFFSPFISYAQLTTDTINLLNGNMVIGTIKHSTGEAIAIKPIKGAKSLYFIDYERIFSINTGKGEELFYRKDTAQ